MSNLMVFVQRAVTQPRAILKPLGRRCFSVVGFSFIPSSLTLSICILVLTKSLITLLTVYMLQILDISSIMIFKFLPSTRHQSMC